MDNDFNCQPILHLCAYQFHIFGDHNFAVLKFPLVPILMFVFCWFSLSAQDHQISGEVKDEQDQPLIGATVKINGTSLGTTADVDGKFSLQVSANDTLHIEFLGYKSEEIIVDGQKELSIILKEATEILNEVIVTALGISRDKKALGYAAENVSIDQISTVRDVNISNSLTGKVAGLEVRKTTGGPASSTRIVIRGNSFLDNNNQALIVVDGVPIDNRTHGSGGEWGGIDHGSGISDINPDDIESVSILKGPNAAALYGSRASNGVVVITTKKGKNDKKVGVTFNSNFTVETPDFQQKYQDVYGAGQNGKFDYNTEGVPYFNTALFGDSWGPKMEGQQFLDWDGEMRSYSPQPDNFKDYYETGFTATNSLSLEGGNEKTSFRLSFTNLQNKNTQPNSKFSRNNLTLRASSKLTDKFTADTKISYARQEALNRLNQSDGRGAGRHYNLMPRSVSNESLLDYKDEAGREKIWYTSWPWMNNPYWMMHENRNEDFRNRITGLVSLTYDFCEKVSLMVRHGQDFWMEERERIEHATGSFANTAGTFETLSLNFSERNSEFLFTARSRAGKGLQVSANLGGNLMYQRFRRQGARTDRLTIPHFYHIEYGEEDRTTVSDFLEEKMINSIYAAVQFGLKDYLFLDLTGRNDWSSTLPEDNNSFFYPSVNLSFVITDLLDLRSPILSFAKVRVSFAEVGTDGRPYLLSATYNSTGDFNGIPQAAVSNTIPKADLKPERSRSYEVGAELIFFQRRISTDITLYKTNTRDQILPADIANSSGFQKAVVNSGEIANKGVEVLLNLIPVRKKNFEWKASVNWSKNRSEVLSLAEGLENLQLARQWGAFVEARVGNSYGDIIGVSIAKDENGNRLVGADGLYLAGPREILGNIEADWRGGISNKFKVKGINISFLIDCKKGGDLFSATNVYGHGYSGVFEATLEGREEWYASEAAREQAGLTSEEWEATGGFVAEGVYAQGTIINGQNVSGTTNRTYVNPKDYWSQFSDTGNEIHEEHVYDASFVKLRELYIGYELPRKVISKIKVAKAEIGFVARNLWLIYSGVPNIDPEATYNNGNGQGLEYGSYPTNRSFGLNLKVEL